MSLSIYPDDSLRAHAASLWYQPADIRRLEAWSAHSAETIYPLQWQSHPSAIRLFAARGEVTHAQIVLRANQPLGEVAIAADPLDGKSRARIAPEHISFRRLAFVHRYRDALLPFESLNLAPGENEVVWLTIRVPNDASAGAYAGAVRFRGANGEKIMPLRLAVWDFTLPETPSLAMPVGISELPFQKRYGLSPDTPEMAALQELWRRTATEYRISPFLCRWKASAEGPARYQTFPSPWPLDDPRTVAWLDDKRLTRFPIPFHDQNESQLRQNIAILRARGWLDRGFIFLANEPQTEVHYAALKNSARKIRDIEPRVKIHINFFRGPSFPPHNGNLQAVSRALGDLNDIFCMNIWAARGHEDAIPKFRAALAPGQEAWSYLCCAPEEPMPNLFARMSGFAHRAVIWRAWKEQHQGLFYWSLNDAGAAAGPDSPFIFRDTLPHGDGALLYPGEPFGCAGPVASVRIERLREALQDYEYLVALEKHIGREKTLRLLQHIYRGPAEFTNDPAAIERFRALAARALTAKLKRPAARKKHP